MNFLAHIYLSGTNEDVILGNFMADGVKGSTYKNYPEQIKNGILLHRFIDNFTDTHPVCLESKILLRPRYHKVSPILVDMIYDHFLAKHWTEYHAQPLREFVDQFYALLERRFDDLTPNIKQMVPYLIKYDWLYNYQFQSGMERVFGGMSRRVRQGEMLRHGWEDIEANRTVLHGHFKQFFSELDAACQAKRRELGAF